MSLAIDPMTAGRLYGGTNGAAVFVFDPLCGDGMLGAGEQCDDGNNAAGDCCSPTCQRDPNGDACTDGNACTSGEACQDGACVGGLRVDCDDHNACTDDDCRPATGCVHTNNTAACDDGDACTVGDTCRGGSCRPGTAKNCSDDNPCTDDSCAVPGGTCMHVNNAAPCAPDTDPCTSDVCDGGSCTHPAVREGGTCNDGNACTVGEVCLNGVCGGGSSRNCDDGNPCTDDSCDPVNGCVHTNNSGPCDDGDACTRDDTCRAGVCRGIPARCGDGIVQSQCFEQCDDGNRVDGDCCSANCRFEAKGRPCGDDGNLCSTDACDGAGACVHGFAPEATCSPPASSRGAQVLLRNKSPDAGDALVWQWTKGARTLKAAFGNPTTTTDYALCLYDERGGTPSLALMARAPAGGTCGRKPCWKTTRKGFTYTNRQGTPDGLRTVVLQEGAA